MQWGENPDPEEALRHYQTSADLGFAGAQNNLCDHYERGEVVPQSDVGAVYWYSRAAERGEPTVHLTSWAIKLVKQLVTNRIDKDHIGLALAVKVFMIQNPFELLSWQWL